MTILFPESNVAPIMGPSGVVTKQLCSTLRVAPSRNNLSEKMNAQKICIYPKINGQTCFYTDLDPIIQVLELSIGSIFQQRAFIFFVHNCRYLLGESQTKRSETALENGERNVIGIGTFLENLISDKNMTFY